MRTATASVHTLHAFGRKGDEMERRRPSIGRRIFRALTRFIVTVLIGVGGTLAWQSYGDAAKTMVAAHSPTLAWLLPPTVLLSLYSSPPLPTVSPWAWQFASAVLPPPGP